MLHVRLDVWLCDRGGSAAVTVLNLAGTLAAGFRRWVVVYVLWGFPTTTLGRACNAILVYYPL